MREVVVSTSISRLFALRIFIVLTTLPPIGCGERDKVTVQGSVDFNGKKVLNGDIRFVPEAGTKGASSGAPIADGTYVVTNKGGVPLGTHRVVLRAFVLEDIGPAAAGAADGDLLSDAQPSSKRSKNKLPIYMFEGREQFLPPQYNARPGLTIEVRGDLNPQIEDFHMRDAPDP